MRFYRRIKLFWLTVTCLILVLIGAIVAKLNPDYEYIRHVAPGSSDLAVEARPQVADLPAGRYVLEVDYRVPDTKAQQATLRGEISGDLGVQLPFDNRSWRSIRSDFRNPQKQTVFIQTTGPGVEVLRLHFHSRINGIAQQCVKFGLYATVFLLLSSLVRQAYRCLYRSRYFSVLASATICVLFLLLVDKILGFIFYEKILHSSSSVGPVVERVKNDRSSYRYMTVGDSVFLQADSLYMQVVPNASEILFPASTNWVMSIFGDYLLFKRYLASHKAPEVLMIGMNSGIVGIDFYTHLPGTDSAILRVFTQIDEIREIYALTKDRSFLLKQLLYKFFNFYPLLAPLKVWLQENFAWAVKVPAAPPESVAEKVSVPESETVARTAPAISFKFEKKTYNEMRQQLDLMRNNCQRSIKFVVKDDALFKRAYEADKKVAAKIPYNRKAIEANSDLLWSFCITQTADLYFRKIIQLAAQHDVRVVYTPTPMTDEKYSQFIFLGMNVLQNAYFSMLEDEFPNFYYVSNHHRHYPASFFGADGIHLGAGGGSGGGVQYFRELDYLRRYEQKTKLGLSEIFTIQNRLH